ncbi:MAG: ABC transporter ATP-binding protein [Thermodesulfobacteriota bacterium]
MSGTVIRVENLSKLYHIGAREAGYRTFRETLVDAVKAPIQRMGSILNRPSSIVNRQSETIWALKDVSFEVKQGEVVGIIGRNGAGKSTLLKILSKITEPTEGRVELCGRVGSLLEVGTGFHPELTGHENIYLYGAILGMNRWEITRKFDEIVSFAEMEKFIDTPVKRYSSGMYMRLAFAVAAHLEPEILLVDEVLAVGDAAFQRKCLGKMGDASKAGRTILFVSHNLNAVEDLCSCGLLLDQGVVRNAGTDVRSIIRDYLFKADENLDSTEWVNSGHEYENPWFKPLRFYISDEQGNTTTMPVSNDSQVFVTIDALIMERDPSLTIGYGLYAENGHLLYWSYQTDGKESEWPRTNKGRVTLRSGIPRHFLNEGAYRIELIGGLHCRQWLFEPGRNVPTLVLRIKGGLSDSPLWMDRRPGMLAPIMTWDLVK